MKVFSRNNIVVATILREGVPSFRVHFIGSVLPQSWNAFPGMRRRRHGNPPCSDRLRLRTSATTYRFQTGGIYPQRVLTTYQGPDEASPNDTPFSSSPLYTCAADKSDTDPINTGPLRRHVAHRIHHRMFHLWSRPSKPTMTPTFAPESSIAFTATWRENNAPSPIIFFLSLDSPSTPVIDVLLHPLV